MAQCAWRNLPSLGCDEWYNICGAAVLVEPRRNNTLAEFLLLGKISVAVRVGERNAGNGDVAVGYVRMWGIHLYQQQDKGPPNRFGARRAYVSK